MNEVLPGRWPRPDSLGRVRSAVDSCSADAGSLFAVVVVLLAWLAWRARRVAVPPPRRPQARGNAIVERNTTADPAPVEDVLAAATSVAEDERVATGDRATGDVRRRGHRSWSATAPATAPPASTSSCRWSPTTARPCWSTAAGWPPTTAGRHPTDVPAPPVGHGHGQGWVRQDATGDSTRGLRPVHPGDLQHGDRPTRSASRRTAASSTSTPRTPSPAAAAGAGRAARPRRRSALLLRAAVVVLRAAGDRRLRLPGVRRVARRPGNRAAPAGPPR